MKTSFGRSSYKPEVILQFILLSESSSAEPDDTLDTKVEGREGMELEKWEVEALEALQKAAKAVTGEKQKLMDDTWLEIDNRQMAVYWCSSISAVQAWSSRRHQLLLLSWPGHWGNI